MTAAVNNPDVKSTRIFPRLDHHDRIPDRRGKKIELLDQRLSRLEKRGRS